MCGICGTTGRDGALAVRAMNAAQAHRGPDDTGTYDDPDGRISLGAHRLSVIDVAGGHQPVRNERGDVWALLNGEIYNHATLREQLRRRGHVFRTRTDTEVLVHLYEEYGADLVHALDGMFAFALWDERRGTLLLARDRFGEKPLFVDTRGGGLAFASELSALLAARRSAPELDLAMVDAFFVLGYVPGPATIVAGVEQLPPGHLLSWDARTRRHTTRPYWTPVRQPVAADESIDELAAETLRLLERSVARTLVADVPVGILLSGGVDSALIAACAATGAARAPHAFTVGYDVGDVSELDTARRTAQVLGIEHHELLLTQDDVAVRAPALLAGLDQPLADQAIVPLHAVSELARRSVTVVVGGEGADELFGGYPRYRWLARSSQLRRVLPRRAAELTLRAVAAAPLDGRLARVGDVLLAPQTLDGHLDWVTDHRRARRAACYGPRLRRYRDADGAVASLRARLPGRDGELGADAFMELDQRHWLPDDVLAKADRAGMRNGLEIRTPYLARDVAEFANSVAADVHLAHAGKQLLRRSLACFLPAADARRRKTAFRVPAAQWLRGPLAPVVEDQVRGGAVVTEGLLDGDALRAASDEHAAGHDRTAVLWPALALGLWFDRFAGRT